MNRKLYYKSVYTTEWKTKVSKAYEKDEQYFVILEETAFYPHGGGQPYDLGNIVGIRVLDVFLKDNEVIHQVEQLPATEEVTCQLDWQRRFDHMQHHSGQHLLSAMFLEVLQARTVSFHLGAEDVTIDVDKKGVSNEQLQMVEYEVNKRIYQNLGIHSYFVTEEQLQEITVVKMPKVTENIRIVEIEGIEFNACGGTHVARTGEIGMIKIFKAEKLKGATRIHFKCGYRALVDFNATLEIIETFSEKFNTGIKDILDRFGKWEQGYKDNQSELTNLKEENESYLAKELLTKVEGNVLAHIFSDKSLKDMQKLAAKLVSEQELIVLFVSTAENKIVLYRSDSIDFSCGTYFKENLPAYNGKGGGNDQSAQAGFDLWEDAVSFFHFTNEQVN